MHTAQLSIFTHFIIPSMVDVLSNRQEAIVDVVMSTLSQWTVDESVDALDWLTVNPQFRAIICHAKHDFVPAIVEHL